MAHFPCESVLIIRPGALGDAVLTLPVIQHLLAKGAKRIVVLGTPANWHWLRATGNGVTIADWNSADWLGLFSPDVELNPHARRQLDGIASAVVYLRSEAEETASLLGQMGISVRTGLPPVWPEAPQDALDDRHAAQRLLAPLFEEEREIGAAANGPMDQNADPLLRLTDEERSAALHRLGLHAPPPDGFFAVHPGSGGRSKCWPVERYAELLRRASQSLPAEPLLFLGPAEEKWVALCGLPQGTRLARSFPLREIMALLSMSRIFVGNDAGVTHLAARCCPTIQLFGATRPSRWKALGSDVTAILAPGGKLEYLKVETVWRAASLHYSSPCQEPAVPSRNSPELRSRSTTRGRQTGPQAMNNAG